MSSFFFSVLMHVCMYVSHSKLLRTMATSQELAEITKSDSVNTQFTIFDQNDCIKIVKDILKEANVIQQDKEGVWVGFRCFSIE